MAMFYTICAVIGGTVLVCQFVLTLMGMSDIDDLADDAPSHDLTGGHDAGGHGSADPHHHDSTWLFGVITFRTIVAALTFFGLAGLAARSNALSDGATLMVALAAGAAAMFGVHWMMQALYRLRAEGTVRVERSVGHVGTVYIPIPANNAGAGKIQINLQNQTVELAAYTSDDLLPTGATIVVTRVLGPEAVEVQRVRQSESISHV